MKNYKAKGDGRIFNGLFKLETIDRCEYLTGFGRCIDQSNRIIEGQFLKNKIYGYGRTIFQEGLYSHKMCGNLHGFEETFSPSGERIKRDYI